MCGAEERTHKLFFFKLEINSRHHIYISVKLSQIIPMEKININKNEETKNEKKLNALK